MAFNECPIGGLSYLALGNDSDNGARAITVSDLAANFFIDNGDGSAGFYANGGANEKAYIKNQGSNILPSTVNSARIILGIADPRTLGVCALSWGDGWTDDFVLAAIRDPQYF